MKKCIFMQVQHYLIQGLKIINYPLVFYCKCIVIQLKEYLKLFKILQ